MNKTLHKLKYPKLILLVFTIFLAYFLFVKRDLLPFYDSLLYLGYFGALITGIFFAYGFTAAPATAVLLMISQNHSIILVSILAGFGAFLGDLIIFKLIKNSFSDELRKLSRERITRKINRVVPNPIKKYVAPIFAGFIIASPLPDEIGVSLLAASKNISTNLFFIISYLLNTLGIFIILSVGNLF